MSGKKAPSESPASRLGTRSNPFKWRRAPYTSTGRSHCTLSLPLAMSVRLDGLDWDCTRLMRVVLFSCITQTRGKLFRSGYADVYIQMSNEEIAASGIHNMRKLSRTLDYLAEAGVLFVIDENKPKARTRLYQMPISALYDEERAYPRARFIMDVTGKRREGIEEDDEDADPEDIDE